MCTHTHAQAHCKFSMCILLSRLHMYHILCTTMRYAALNEFAALFFLPRASANKHTHMYMCTHKYAAAARPPADRPPLASLCVCMCVLFLARLPVCAARSRRASTIGPDLACARSTHWRALSHKRTPPAQLQQQQHLRGSAHPSIYA